ncbi:hypothetical protein EYF80_043584 [Liparis tanakae]|uniref:Uncharacterized protein n=1 Tax=Liparis tanakae TaxID=230148 RepID=A0A4Z2G097_9TELE|nr:hypothetical protein EYF80_043584 [Liparis tanakae]
MKRRRKKRNNKKKEKRKRRSSDLLDDGALSGRLRVRLAAHGSSAVISLTPLTTVFSSSSCSSSSSSSSCCSSSSSSSSSSSCYSLSTCLSPCLSTCVQQLDDGGGVLHVQRHVVQPVVVQQEEEDAQPGLEGGQRLRPPGRDVIGVVPGPEPLLVLVLQEEVLQLLPPEVQLVLVVALHRLRLVHAVLHVQQEVLWTQSRVRTNQSRTNQSRTNQSRTNQSRTNQARTDQNQPGQNRSEPTRPEPTRTMIPPLTLKLLMVGGPGGGRSGSTIPNLRIT